MYSCTRTISNPFNNFFHVIHPFFFYFVLSVPIFYSEIVFFHLHVVADVSSCILHLFVGKIFFHYFWIICWSLCCLCRFLLLKLNLSLLFLWCLQVVVSMHWSYLQCYLFLYLSSLLVHLIFCFVIFFFHLHFFYHVCRANLLHSLIIWLMVSSLSPHSLHLLFCWALSILALIWLVLMALSCAAIRRDSVSLLKFPFLSHVDKLLVAPSGFGS